MRFSQLFHYLKLLVKQCLRRGGEPKNWLINKVLMKGVRQGSCQTHTQRCQNVDSARPRRPALTLCDFCTTSLSPQSRDLLSAKCDVDNCLLDGDRNSFPICQAAWHRVGNDFLSGEAWLDLNPWPRGNRAWCRASFTITGCLCLVTPSPGLSLTSAHAFSSCSWSLVRSWLSTGAKWLMSLGKQKMH